MQKKKSFGIAYCLFIIFLVVSSLYIVTGLSYTYLMHTHYDSWLKMCPNDAKPYLKDAHSKFNT